MVDTGTDGHSIAARVRGRPPTMRRPPARRGAVEDRCYIVFDPEFCPYRDAHLILDRDGARRPLGLPDRARHACPGPAATAASPRGPGRTRARSSLSSDCDAMERGWSAAEETLSTRTDDCSLDREVAARRLRHMHAHNRSSFIWLASRGARSFRQRSHKLFLRIARHSASYCLLPCMDDQSVVQTSREAGPRRSCPAS